MLLKTQSLTLTDSNFQVEVLQAQTPVLIDCWASWCSASQRMSPVIEELAIVFANHIKVGRLNIATCDPLATRYGIRAVPTLLVFIQGQIVERTIGVPAQEHLTHKLNALLSDPVVGRSSIVWL